MISIKSSVICFYESLREGLCAAFCFGACIYGQSGVLADKRVKRRVCVCGESYGMYGKLVMAQHLTRHSNAVLLLGCCFIPLNVW